MSERSYNYLTVISWLTVITIPTQYMILCVYVHIHSIHTQHAVKYCKIASVPCMCRCSDGEAGLCDFKLLLGWRMKIQTNKILLMRHFASVPRSARVHENSSAAMVNILHLSETIQQLVESYHNSKVLVVARWIPCQKLLWYCRDYSLHLLGDYLHHPGGDSNSYFFEHKSEVG